MDKIQDPRQWAKEPKISLAERRAKELEAICEVSEERMVASMQSNEDSPLARLRTLCSLIRGTDSLKEYVLELLETNTVQGFPRQLLVRAEKGEFGIFDLPVAQQFERYQILIAQPAEMEKCLQSRDKSRAAELCSRIKRWKMQFEKLYEEPVESGVSKKELTRHLRHIRETVMNETKGSLSS